MHHLDEISDHDDDKLNLSGNKVITVIDNRQIRLQKIVSGLMAKFKEEGAYTHLGYESVTLSADTVKSLGLSVDGESAQMSGRKGLYVNADTVLETLTKRVYDESKRFAETLASTYVREFNLDVKIARIFNTFGPKMNKDDGRVVSNLIMQSLQNKDLTLYGDGSQTRSFCFVSDLIDGIVKLMDSSITSPVNIGNPCEFTIKELAEKIRKVKRILIINLYFLLKTWTFF